MSMISLDYARKNYTPGQLRILANSLSRIGGVGYFANVSREDGQEYTTHESAYDRGLCFKTARLFREYAAKIEYDNRLTSFELWRIQD